MKVKYLTLFICICLIGIISLTNISAWSNNSFNNSLTIENMTFTSLNNFKGTSTNNSAIDNDLTTYAIGDIYINFTNFQLVNNLNYYFYQDVETATSLYCKNLTDGSWISLAQPITNSSVILPSSCIGFNTQVRFQMTPFGGNSDRLYEASLNLTGFNLVRYLSIPQNTILTKGFLNLSGYNIYNDYYSDKYSFTNGSTLYNFNNLNDKDWNTYSYIIGTSYPQEGNAVLFFNYTFENDTTNIVNYTFKRAFDSSLNNYRMLFNFSVWNYTSNSWYVILELNYYNNNADNLTYNYSLSNGYTINSPLQIKIDMGILPPGGSPYTRNNYFFEGTVNYTQYPYNPSIQIGNSNAWNFTRTFNQTNNKTNNLATSINNYLGICNYISGFCQVPFIFHSDTAGILQYLGLIFNNIGFLENSQTFSSTAYQSSNEEFKINLTYDSNYYNSALGTLYYNGTNYTGSSTTINGNTIISKTLPITSSYLGTQTFYWIIALTNSSGTYYFNSTFNNQTIAPIRIQICNSTFNVSYVNFSVKNMEDYSVLNSSFKATFTIGSYVYSFQDTSQTNSSFAFCFDPSYKNYTLDAKLEFEKTGYAKNYYYLSNAVLTNKTTNISLYLLNETKATLTLFKTINRGQQAIPDIYIQIQKYDVGTDTYYTIGILKTDYNGQDLAYLNWYDTFYKAILIQNGSVIKTTSPYKILESPQEFTILDNLAFEYDKFGNIVYSLTFNNVTNNFILTYTLPSGEVTSACLRVIKRSAYNDTTICNTCETSSSATIYCNVGSYGNGTFIGTFYATGSLSFIETIQTVIGVTNQIYDLLGNQDATIYAFLFAGIILVMFMITPVLAIVGIILGVLGGMAMGFQPFNFVEFIGIVIIGGVIIWILKR